jgi:hypothetical protein
MPDIVEEGELLTEEEVDETPFVEFKVVVVPTDPTLDNLSQYVKSGEIKVPFYQRKYVWKIEQASKLIESFLMGLPVPQVFLYVNDDEVLEIIDGQQRIMSIKYFFEGFFGEADANNKRQVFRLKGLSQRSEYNGKTFEELLPRDQRKLKNTPLRAIQIKQLKPRDSSDVVFHIFERLNTGGTQLKAQEIRNAVYRGPIVEKLAELNQDKAWRGIIGIPRADKYQKDIELILRLFSLFEAWDDYEKPMIKYLNDSMRLNRDFSSERANRFSTAFLRACGLVHKSLKKPFRPKGVINAAMLEAVMVAVMEDERIGSDQLLNGYGILLSDDRFSELISQSTADTAVLKNRIRAAKVALT